MLPTVLYLYPQNTLAINVTGLVDVVSGIFLNLATVSATLYDSRGNPDSVLNNITLGYLPGSNGNYQGQVPATFDPPAFHGRPKGSYSLVITANQAGVQSVFTIPVILQARSQQ